VYYLRASIPVRRPAIIDDRNGGFDPCLYNGHQSASGYVRNGNWKRFTRMALNTTKHPLLLNRVAPMIFTPTELALFDFESLVGTADPLRAAMQVLQHGWSAELAPVSYGSGNEAMFALDKVGRYAAQDVACEEHNFLESEVTPLKP
jgi:hypothetical protein